MVCICNVLFRGLYLTISRPSLAHVDILFDPVHDTHRWAEKKPDQNKEAIAILKKHGAISLAPGAKKNQPADESKDKKVERSLTPKKAD